VRQQLTLFAVCGCEVDLDDVGELQQCIASQTLVEVVESDQIAGRLQASARFKDFVIWLDVLQDLDNEPLFGQGVGVLVDERRAREIDECSPASRQRLDAEDEEAVRDDRERGVILVSGVELVLKAGTGQQLVAEQLRLVVKYRLAS
jgi:hypothetical protein